MLLAGQLLGRFIALVIVAEHAAAPASARDVVAPI